MSGRGPICSAFVIGCYGERGRASMKSRMPRPFSRTRSPPFSLSMRPYEKMPRPDTQAHANLLTEWRPLVTMIATSRLRSAIVATPCA